MPMLVMLGFTGMPEDVNDQDEVGVIVLKVCL